MESESWFAAPALAGPVKLEVPRRGAADVLHVGLGERASAGELVVHSRDRDDAAVAVKDEHKVARAVTGDAPANVGMTVEGVWDGVPICSP